ncbi:zinc ribbon domain-containing protein [Halegenticoccus tardaugens]|uniref:zinc ribbon domain-containing protein n=1 Tax=Halegenticoccus tardaugens TaxID=2071624 RepID=UPI00100B21D1|nr:zinc ribbon domain-containing protein [Halegenticoccus tardaugens]
MSSNRGIVATGVYVPRHRLTRDEIEAAWGTSTQVSRAAVPAADEDTLTMAVAAGRDALSESDVATTDIGHVAIATTTPPLEEGEFAPQAAAALGLADDCRLETSTQSTAVGADALRSAATADVPALAVVADAPEGDPAAVGQRVGAGAAAFLFADGGDVTLVDMATRSRDAPGVRFRERGSETVAEPNITTYEREVIRDLVAASVEALDVDHDAVTGVSLYQPTPDIPHRIARSLPYDGEAVGRGTLIDDVGDAGTATTALGLLAALDSSAPDSVTVAGFFGSGATATALAFEIREPIKTDVAEAVDGGRDVSYTTALRERGTLGQTDVSGGGAHVSLPSWQRTVPQRYRLVAGQCPDCGAIAFPPEGACPRCHERVAFTDVELSRTGEIVAVTTIGQGGAPPEFVELQRRDGSFAVAIVENTTKGESAQFPVQLTDCDPQTVSVGDRVVGQFRRIYSAEGVTRYGLKFTPE